MTQKQESRAGRSRRAKQAIILIACLVAAGVSAESTGTSPRVLQVVQPQSADRDPEMQEILTRFLRIELARAGLTPVLLGDDKPAVAAAALAALAAEQRARFVLLAAYARHGRQVDLRLDWFDAATASISATETRTAAIDLELDVAVASAARQLLDRTGARRDRIDASPPEITDRSGAQPPVLVPGPGALPAAEGPFYRFESSIALSAVLVNGYASDYFKYGFMPSLYAGYRFRVAGGALALGVSTGYSLYTIEADLDEVGVQAAPIGIETRCETGGAALVYVRLAAGPALQCHRGDRQRRSHWHQPVVGRRRAGRLTRVLRVRRQPGIHVHSQRRYRGGLSQRHWSVRRFASAAPGQLYTVRIEDALDAFAEATVTVAPAAPTNPAADGSYGDPHDIRLTWTDNATGETGYEVWQKIGSGAFARIHIAAPDTAAHVVTGLNPNTAYTYKMRAAAHIARSSAVSRSTSAL